MIITCATIAHEVRWTYVDLPYSPIIHKINETMSRKQAKLGKTKNFDVRFLGFFLLFFWKRDWVLGVEIFEIFP